MSGPARAGNGRKGERPSSLPMRHVSSRGKGARGPGGAERVPSSDSTPRSSTMADAAEEEPLALRDFKLNDRTNILEKNRAQKWAGNSVSTAKYTLLTFVPKTIFEFFRIVANMYFLLISCLQAFTDLSPTNKYTTAGPLLVVLLISMLKQFVEDWKRHAADKEMNARVAHRIGEGGRVDDCQWRDIRVGDLLVVRDHEELPADVIVLSTTEEEGRCFVETANLDGETNLKRRHSVKDVNMMVGHREIGQPWSEELPERQARAAKQLQGSVQYEDKNNSLYTFVGTLRARAPDGGAASRAGGGAGGPGKPTGELELPVGPAEVILRGCNLRNCHSIIGLVIYTGPDTKLMQNSRPTPSKQSNAYKVVNRCILLIFVTQFVMCVFSAIGFGIWSGRTETEDVWYMGSVLANVNLWEKFKAFLTFIMLYNNLVPISLYVSLDMIKVAQAKFMENDPDMMYQPEEGPVKSAKVRTSDLNEDLGQIEYIFSDKTGTLTRNMMEFRKCSIGGVAYGFGTTEIGRAAEMRRTAGTRRSVKIAVSAGSNRGVGAATSTVNPLDGLAGSPAPEVAPAPTSPGGRPVDTSAARGVSGLTREQQDKMADASRAQVILDPKIHFDDPRLIADLRSGSARAPAIRDFLTLLAVCHTVIPERDSRGVLQYRASSPDEEALVKAAKCLGFDFVTPAPVVTVMEHTRAGDTPRGRRYQILNINEFNSTRKRMSVVVRSPEGQIVLYCKGADNVMFERSNSVWGSSIVTLKAHLRAFAGEGLRTLVLARKVLSPGEYASWNAAYTAAAASLVNREEKLMEVAEQVERDMQIIGATAIEDKLQEGVPDTIADLARAGIKIWVLTGDKTETAINIGYACRLLTESMTLVHVDGRTVSEIESQLGRIQSRDSIRPLLAMGKTSDKLALIVDGSALTQIFMQKDATPERKARSEVMSRDLLRIARCCRAVVACRVSPAQKAAIVQLVRRNVTPAPMTLAIGDGANDVNMIQTAQVGVGISGQEGVQAVNSSDYAIAQFRFLRSLLLVHGRANYQRISKVILYSFYKNIALVVSLFVFNFYNGFSGTSLYESFVMAGWNFFLAVPIIVIGVFDTDVFSHVADRHPALYMSGQESQDLNVRRFVIWIANAVYHGLLVYALTAPLMDGVLDEWGTQSGLHVRGTIVYSCMLMVMNLKVALECRVWVGWFHFFWWGSIAFFFLFCIVYNALASNQSPTGPFAGVTTSIFSTPSYWFALLLVPTTCILLDVMASAYAFAFHPTPHDVLRYHERYARPDERPRCPHQIRVVDDADARPIDLRGLAGAVDQSRNPNLGFAFNHATEESYFAHASQRGPKNKGVVGRIRSTVGADRQRSVERKNPLLP